MKDNKIKCNKSFCRKETFRPCFGFVIYRIQVGKYLIGGKGYGSYSSIESRRRGRGGSKLQGVRAKIGILERFRVHVLYVEDWSMEILNIRV